MHSAGVNRMRRHVHFSLRQHPGNATGSLERAFGQQIRPFTETKQSHSAAGPRDDLSRNVYGILGIPVDAVDVSGVLQSIEEAAANGKPFLISTPNLNFLVSSRTDAEFRESLLMSDLCPVDGVPIVWIACLLGLPITRRVAGSDIFEALKSRDKLSHSSKLFLFGGPEGVAQSACEALNARSQGVVCVGSIYPGFCSMEDMSTDEVLRAINSSEADFLIVSLGAKKGQSWLLHNHHHLKIPVRSHLGAAINFQAGTLKRAPMLIRKFGFEWLWRIKEEPYLWSRYWRDGTALLKLLLTCVLPLMVGTLSQRLVRADRVSDLRLVTKTENSLTTIILTGAATEANVALAVTSFRAALAGNKDLSIDMTGVHVVDARFFGLFLMVSKQLKECGKKLYFQGLSVSIKRAFKLHGFEFLLRSAS